MNRSFRKWGRTFPNPVFRPHRLYLLFPTVFVITVVGLRCYCDEKTTTKVAKHVRLSLFSSILHTPLYSGFTAFMLLEAPAVHSNIVRSCAWCVFFSLAFFCQRIRIFPCSRRWHLPLFPFLAHSSQRLVKMKLPDKHGMARLRMLKAWPNKVRDRRVKKVERTKEKENGTGTLDGRG